ncbi:MAG TPA: allantoinase AllB [Thermoanaerobaculia bacterium]|nr:allantoinase AllB [Thermoanaerobaculia bacterium]
MSAGLVLRSIRVVTPEGVRPATIHIRQGRIERVGAWDEAPTAGEGLTDCGDSAILPGVVDSHVHINEPGRTDWEGFETATRSAAAGGTTTLVDMPLNSIPATTTREALRSKIEVAQGKTRVDVGFWGGVVPGNATERPGLLEDGVLGFKAFLVPSGVDEFQHVGEADLREALPVLARHGSVLLAHAELPGPIDAAAGVWQGAGPAELREYDRFLRSRPDAAEVAAVELLVRLCRETGCRVHIVHVASAEVLPVLRRAREEGLPVTAETCPHYLTFSAEEIPDGAVAFKCAPPIRSRENRELLWVALGEGILDLVASDHSPCPPDLKKVDAGGFRGAWGGIASLQLALPAVWTGARERGFTIADLAGWMCTGPARLAGLEGRKGKIAPGCDADLVVWDPEESFQVDPRGLYHRHKLTPYAGRTLYGAVRRTLLRGETVYDVSARDRFSGPPSGQLLRRGKE